MIQWLGENLQIIATLGSASVVYGIMRYGARKDAKKLADGFSDRINKIESKFESIDKRLDNSERKLENIEKALLNIEIVLRSLDVKVDQINLRLTHFEGSFEERRYWTQRECVRIDGASQ